MDRLRTLPLPPFCRANLARSLVSGTLGLVTLLSLSGCVTPQPAAHPLAVFYLDYSLFPQGYLNSGFLDAGSLYIYDNSADTGERPIVRKITPVYDASVWTTPSPLSQTMTASAGGGLSADASVINPAWQLAIKAYVLKQTSLDLENGKKYELRDPATYVTKAINDPNEIGEFSGYADKSRYTLLVVDSYIDGSMTLSAGLDPNSNQLSVKIAGKVPISVDISDLKKMSTTGSKILIGFKSYRIHKNANGSLELSEDRRQHVWSDPLKASQL
jgi:hypothetical protein